jgi:hypothetical protein
MDSDESTPTPSWGPRRKARSSDRPWMNVSDVDRTERKKVHHHMSERPSYQIGHRSVAPLPPQSLSDTFTGSLSSNSTV